MISLVVCVFMTTLVFPVLTFFESLVNVFELVPHQACLSQHLVQVEKNTSKMNACEYV